MARLEELRLIAKVARLYYDLGYTQVDIAHQLDLSQASISRLLKRAVDEGIVRITVSMPTGVFTGLEERIRTQFNMREVIVVDCDSTDEKAIMREIGSAAAFYLENTMKADEVIGLSSWSETLLAMVDQMHRVPRKPNAQVLQILGGIGHADAEVQAARLTDRLAQLIQGTAVYLPAPGVVGSVEARRIFMEDQYVNRVLALFEKITLALVGIGTVAPSGLLASSGNIYSEEELKTLNEVGAVGDICLRFFNEHGNPVQTPLNDRVIGLGLEQLRTVDRAVGIAGGKRKRAAIRAALLGNWINVLITDRLTAEWLVETTGS